MDIKKLQALVVDSLEDVKAQDIRVFDTVHLTAEHDRVAIASGTSNRQTKALAASVRDKVKEAGGTIHGIEGEDTGEWVLVDLGSIVVHIMQPAIRDYYRLEELWGGKEVKVGAAKRTSKRTASEDESKPAPRTRAAYAAVEASQASLDDDDAPRKPARKTASKTATRTTAGTATKTAAKTASKTAGKTSAKTAAKTPRTPAGRTVRVAASKSASAPRKTAAKRPAAKKTAS